MESLLKSKAYVDYYTTFLPRHYSLCVDKYGARVLDEIDSTKMYITLDSSHCMVTTDMKANDLYFEFGEFLDELCSDFNGSLVICSRDYQGWY